MSERDERIDKALLDLAHKSNDEIRELLNELHVEEQRISYRRRVLHGKIDILRAELVRRLKDQREAGQDVISGADVDRLITILASDLWGGGGADIDASSVTQDEGDED